MVKEEELIDMAKANQQALIASLTELPFGVKLRAVRSMLAISLDALAARLGVSKAFLSMIERGEQHPGMKTLGQIRDVFGSDLNVLYENVKNQPKD